MCVHGLMVEAIEVTCEAYLTGGQGVVRVGIGQGYPGENQ